MGSEFEGSSANKQCRTCVSLLDLRKHLLRQLMERKEVVVSVPFIQIPIIQIQRFPFSHSTYKCNGVCVSVRAVERGAERKRRKREKEREPLRAENFIFSLVFLFSLYVSLLPSVRRLLSLTIKGEDEKVALPHVLRGLCACRDDTAYTDVDKTPAALPRSPK